MWVSHSQFFGCVSEAWNVEDVGGSRFYSIVSKLKRLKVALRSWNKQIFGRTKTNIAKLEARIKGLEDSLHSTFSKEVEIDLVVSQLELSIWLDREKQRLAQQAKQGWIKKGEANSAFFML